MLYHYTDLRAFLSIVEKKALWLSSINGVNDYKEMLWMPELLNKAFDKAVYELPQLAKSPTEYRKTLDQLLTVLQRSELKPHICCFSSRKDSLSQWRAYSNDGTGVSLGFHRSSLKNLNKNNYFKGEALEVIYNEDIQLQKIINTIKLSLEEGFSKGINLDLMLQIVENTLTFKNPAFEEEEEFRVVKLATFNKELLSYPDELNSRGWKSIDVLPKFRVTSNTISSYFEFSFQPEDIKEIFIGPKSNLNIMDVEMILATNDIDARKVNIFKSGASYR